MEVVAKRCRRSTSSTDSVTSTFVNTMFQLLWTCVVLKGKAAHSASQVTTSAFIIHSLLSILECFGSSPWWTLRQWSMWHHFSLSRNQVPMPRLTTSSPTLVTWFRQARPKKTNTCGRATKLYKLVNFISVSSTRFYSSSLRWLPTESIRTTHGSFRATPWSHVS